MSSPMQYISTRGIAPKLDFEGVLLTGLASDGGLYVPETLPSFSPSEIAAMAGKSYEDIAEIVLKPFVAGTIVEPVLRRLIDESYATFRHQAIAPLKQLAPNEWVLELFHGPTLAFKDFALQLLGRLLDYVLEKRNEHVTIVGATSGDTGSAAIEGCRACKHVDIVILHPHNRVSDVQRRQMTTVLADNVHNIALEGNFDDCQAFVKAMFEDQSFLGGKRRLVAVNSINWARIMAQIVYYFYAGVQLGAPAVTTAYSVPTGNFGDIFAGYLAKKMGLPIGQLIVATNSNDILHRFMSANQYHRGTLQKTLSPSMDIQVSSNFERLLFDLYERDGKAINDLLRGFKDTGKLSIDTHRLTQAQALFSSAAVDDKTTCDTIREVYNTGDMLLDPHTAIGVRAARERRKDKHHPMITLATAHPAKFSEAIEKAGLPAASLPPYMSDLMSHEERYTVLPAELEKVKAFVVRVSE